jgi:beta-galactosidase
LRRTLAAIRLSGDKDTIDVQSGVVAHIKAEVFDKNSIAVPDAENLIHLTLEGADNLIGFDNGNQGDSTFMKSSQRKLFNGLALAVIQTDGKPAIIRMTASSVAFKEASLEIITQRITVPLATPESLKK